MKKILLLLTVVLTVSALNSQTLNQTVTWPDATWTITGTYSAANLLLDPTVGDSNFKFDDAQFSNSGEIIYLESPVVDLRTAFTANEKVLIFSIDLAFATTLGTSETLGLQYYDADANSGAGAWVLMPDGQPSSGESQGDYTNCTLPGAFSIYFDFKGFTTNQQQNFRYRFFYNDGGLAAGKGLCMSAPTLTSANISCSAPTALQTTSLGSDSAQIGWTANSSEGQWNFEYGPAGFTKGSGTSDMTDMNPSGINGLSSNTSYDFYVRANCIPAMAGGSVYSSWSSKLNFTTTNSCTAPNGGLGNNIKPTSFNITWAPQGPETAWNIEYGLVDYIQGGPSSLGNFGTSDNTGGDFIDGLTASTSYDFYVQAICGGGSLSSWAGPYTVTTAAYSLGWFNLQWPQNGSINAGDTFDVYAQVYSEQKTDVSGQTAAATGIKSWIGWSPTDTNPNTWPESNWIAATFNTASLSANNDEYSVNLGATLTTAGTYYYASRFQLFTGPLKYGGFQSGPWDGSSNVSGQLTVTGTLGIDDNNIEGFSFYPNPVLDRLALSARQNINQVEVYNLLGQVLMVIQPNQTNYELQLGSLKSGIYFLKVTVADKTGTYKIVKQ